MHSKPSIKCKSFRMINHLKVYLEKNIIHKYVYCILNHSRKHKCFPYFTRQLLQTELVQLPQTYEPQLQQAVRVLFFIQMRQCVHLPGAIVAAAARQPRAYEEGISRGGLGGEGVRLSISGEHKVSPSLIKQSSRLADIICSSHAMT